MNNGANYNASDDEEEYDDSSLLESDEEKAALIRNRTMNGESGLDDTDDKILSPTFAETREMEEEKKEMFRDVVKLWFPKNVDVYAIDKDDENGGRECIVTDGERREDAISRFVEEAYEQCNQFGRAIGEQGMHCLLQNKDYRNGWNDFKRFVEDIFRSSKNEINFYHADSTNYFDLTYDGNYDSLSMKKMGYFSLGPSFDVTFGRHEGVSLANWTMPTEDTWMRTIRNSGYSHVTIIPVTYELITSNVDKSQPAKNPSHAKDVWIVDPDYDRQSDDAVTNVAAASSFSSSSSSSYQLSVLPLSVMGNKRVRIFIEETELNKGTFVCKSLLTKGSEQENVTRLYRIVVNFVGQPKTPAWWNTKSKHELAEQNLRQNVDTLSNVQDRLEKMSLANASTLPALEPESYAHPVARSNVVSSPTIEPIVGAKRKRSSSAEERIGDRQKRSKAKKTTTVVVAMPVVDPNEKGKYEDLEEFLDDVIAHELYVKTKKLVDPWDPGSDRDRFYDMDDEACFGLYSDYVVDIVEEHLLSKRLTPKGLWRIGNFFSNYVLPDVMNVDFKVVKLNVSKNRGAETCAFTGNPIATSTAYAVKCFSLDDEKTPLNAFIIANDKKGVDAMVSFIKSVKYYKQMIDMRMDGLAQFSFLEGPFSKHFAQLRRFKRYVVSIAT